VRYCFSQPWPFPSSLMIGLIAEVTNQEVTPDPVELDDHRWLTRDEARAMQAGDHPDIRPSSPVAIAHWLVKAWVEEE
jgi:NAD+ diphosphatase